MSSATIGDRRRARYVTVCTGCGRDLSGAYHPACPECGAMSDVAYDLEAVRWRESENPYLRFLDLIPVLDPELLPDGARFTPTVHARRLGRELGLEHLYLKDETGQPTGTTKDRMAAVALPYLRESGVRRFTTSSTGNSSSAYAHAIGRLADLTMYVFTAADFRHRLALPPGPQVVDVVLEDATFVEAFEVAGRFAARHGLASERGFFNPGRREGLKVAWLEAVEQVPRPIDWYVQAVSSAMGVYGVHKAGRELVALGRAPHPPRLLCVQQESCAPMVTAWRDGSEVIRAQDIVDRPTGIASAILRGDPSRTYGHVRRIVRESDGDMVAVSEAEIRDAQRRLDPIPVCGAAAAAFAGLVRARDSGLIGARETVLVNLTGAERPDAAVTEATHRLPRAAGGWDLDALAPV
jgi:threonine synthase